MRHLTKTTCTRSLSATVLVIGLTTGCVPFDRDTDDAETPLAGASSSPAAAHPSFLYGRITTIGGDRYEGRLRFGGDEEAFWGDYFNGFKDGNPWVDYVPSGSLRENRRTIRFLGLEVGYPGARADLRRQLMVRFGDIAELEARGRDLRVTMKSGMVFHLDRFAADDFADGVRVWDGTHGVVDLDEDRVRTIEFLPPARPADAPPHRLHGTVYTTQGDFTGFIQWGREGSIGLDELTGYTVDGERVALPFITVRSIARRSSESARVTLFDGREVVLGDTRDVGRDNRGIYVDDPRYGRVLIPWDDFDRAEFHGVGSASADGGPAYDSFPAGQPLTGSVTTHAGRRLSGRLVFDLDESETTQTLDAPSEGVHYTIPFGRVASVVLPGRADHARLILQNGRELQLERDDDLGDGNAGMLIFSAGRERPEYVRWADVARVDFGRPSAM